MSPLLGTKKLWTVASALDPNANPQYVFKYEMLYAEYDKKYDKNMQNH
jgi:hypothetical protein